MPDAMSFDQLHQVKDSEVLDAIDGHLFSSLLQSESEASKSTADVIADHLIFDPLH